VRVPNETDEAENPPRIRSKSTEQQGMMLNMARAGAARKRQEPIRSVHRQQELEWIQTHPDEMHRLAGEWVVLEGEELIAHGNTATRVAASARRKGIAVPFIFFVESPEAEGTAHFGL
jgi:hypothetical protein